jgi:hypothetical protein
MTSMSFNRSASESPAEVGETFKIAEVGKREVVLIASFFGLMIATMKIAPRMGDMAPQLVLPQLMILIGVLLLLKKAYVPAKRIMLYALFIGVAAAANMISGGNGQTSSFMFLVIISLCYCFEVKISQEGYTNYLKIFQKFGAIAALLVYIDWAFQIAHLPMPDIEMLIPKSWLFYNYVYIQPLNWGNRFMKPNGLFFLETSFVSQFIAFALIFEFCLFRRLGYIVLLGTALVASFGGTGMLLLALSSPVILFYFRLKLLPLALIALPIGGFTAVQLGVLDNVVQRSSEFDKAGSSGNMRFTNQLQVLVDIVDSGPLHALVGRGSGVMPQQLNMLFTPLAKVPYEYGFITSIFWLVFIIYCSFGRGVPFIVSWVMLVQYMLLNGSLLVPICNAYIVVLCSLFRVTGSPSWSSFSDLRMQSSTFFKLGNGPLRIPAIVPVAGGSPML